MLLCRHYISPLNTFMRKGKNPKAARNAAFFKIFFI
jgi:hypothetical protein